MRDLVILLETAGIGEQVGGLDKGGGWNMRKMNRTI